ncbi:hypothetical protein ABZP36_007369 [Zizania latifolia]
MTSRSRLTPTRAPLASCHHLPGNPSSPAPSSVLLPARPEMASTPPPPPPPVIGKAGNLTVFITPPATPSPVATPRSRSPDSPPSEFSTPSGSPRAAEESPPSLRPPAEQPVKAASSPLAPRLVTPPPVKMFSPPLPAAKLSFPKPPPVQVPPSQFEKAEARSDGSVLAMFWDAVARMQEAHASLDEYISNWFGLDQSKYQWALNDYYESTGKEVDSGETGKPKELSKMQD